MPDRNWAAIVLAAGFSNRMNAFKPLLTIGGETITDRVIDLFTAGGVQVLLVTGWRQDELIAGIKNRAARIIHNPDYVKGMFSSVQAGVKHLPPHCAAFFVMPVDIPLVRPATVARLLPAAAANPAKIIYPVFGGRRGHPPLIPVALAPRISAWQQEGGLKAVLNSQENMALEIAVPDGNVHFDMDTPADFTEALTRFQRYEIPTDAECAAIWDIYEMQPDKRRHCDKVAEIAVKLSRALSRAGYAADREIIRAAALLHDVAKGQPKHDIAGGRILQENGFGRVGEIVALHTDLAAGNNASLEAKIVYLADKFVAGQTLVSIEERYQSSLQRFSDNPAIVDSILQRKKRALQVTQEIENLLGCSLDQVISR